MVKGFARIQEFKEVKAFKYFVFRISKKNAAVDYIRSRNVRRNINANIINPAAETAEDFDRHYIYSHAISVIYQQIATTPCSGKRSDYPQPGQRRVIGPDSG